MIPNLPPLGQQLPHWERLLRDAQTQRPATAAKVLRLFRQFCRLAGVDPQTAQAIENRACGGTAADEKGAPDA